MKILLMIIAVFYQSTASAESMFGGNSNYDKKHKEMLLKQLNSSDLEFRLVDQFGDPHSLSDYSKAKEVYIVNFDSGCKAAETIEEMKKKMGKSKNALLFLINNPEIKREQLAEQFPKEIILMDEYQQISNSLNLKIAGEYAVFSPKKNSVIRTASLFKENNCKNYLTTHDRSTLQTKVLPSFAKACIGCHSAMNSLSYFGRLEEVASWKKMMLRTIRLRRMPPGADPYYTNLNYTAEDVRNVVKWLEDGGTYTPEDLTHFMNTKKANFQRKKAEFAALGREPLKLISYPSEVIRATGADFYRHYTTNVPTKEDYYFDAFRIKSNDNVGHHLALHYRDIPFPKVSEKTGTAINPDEGMLLYGNNPEETIGWVNGVEIKGKKFIDPNIIHVTRKQGLQRAPEGTVFFIPKGSYLNFEIHYNPSGREETTEVELEIFPVKNPEKLSKVKRFSMTPHDGVVVAKPHQSKSKVVMQWTLKESIGLKGYGLHMHFRGKSGKVMAQRPGETKPQMLFSFPTYQYKNQLTSISQDEIFLPKGTVLTNEIIYDNSKINASNPDPRQLVKIGTSASKEENYLPRFMYVEKNDAP